VGPGWFAGPSVREKMHSFGLLVGISNKFLDGGTPRDRKIAFFHHTDVETEHFEASATAPEGRANKNRPDPAISRNYGATSRAMSMLRSKVAAVASKGRDTPSFKGQWHLRALLREDSSARGPKDRVKGNEPETRLGVILLQSARGLLK
jgi:hypothetical protein